MATFQEGGLFDSNVTDDISQVFTTMLFGENSPALAPEAPEPEMVGTREESSVLFSLENLMDRAGGADGSRLPKDQISGLIDIRRLVATSPSTRDVTDSVMHLGGIGFESNHFGPVLSVVPRKPGLALRISAVAGAALALVGIVVLAAYLLTDGEQPAAKPASPAEQLKSLVDRVAALTPEQTPLRSASLLGIGGRGDGPLDDNRESASVATPGSVDGKAERTKKPRSRSASRRGSAARNASSSSKAAVGSSEIDALLDGAMTAPSRSRSKKKARRRARKKERASSTSKPKKLSRSQVKAGLGSVSRRVKRCGQGRVHGILTVEVTIKGDGRVARVRPTGPYAGTSAGVCAARAVRRARFPAFSGPRMTVRYPYRF